MNVAKYQKKSEEFLCLQHDEPTQYETIAWLQDVHAVFSITLCGETILDVKLLTQENTMHTLAHGDYICISDHEQYVFRAVEQLKDKFVEVS